MKRLNILIGAVLAVAVVAGLYFVNRMWIVPLAKRTVAATGNHLIAPDFTLTDISGNKLSLSDYRGKVVLLDFWATWCGPCRIEIPGFVELQNRYRGQGLAVVGVSMDDGPEPVREFYKEFRMNYRVVLGSDKIGELYGGVYGFPTTFLIGRDGRIYAKHVGAADISVFEEEIKQLLAAQGPDEITQFKQVGRASAADKIELGDPAEVNSEIPGLNLSKLSAAEITQLKKRLEKVPCNCGCNLNVLKCRQDDPKCATSKKFARDEFEKFTKSRV